MCLIRLERPLPKRAKLYPSFANPFVKIKPLIKRSGKPLLTFLKSLLTMERKTLQITFPKRILVNRIPT